MLKDSKWIWFNWKPAQDNTGIYRYAWSLNGERQFRVFDEENGSYTLLTPCTVYELEIIAIDYAGNESIDNPKITFTTGYSYTKDNPGDTCENFFDN